MLQIILSLAFLALALSTQSALAQEVGDFCSGPAVPLEISYGICILSTSGGGSSSQHDPLFGATSPPHYPSPWMDGSGNWKQAYLKAQALVKQLSLLEKVNLTSGTGWMSDGCVGNTGSVPRLGIASLCLQDSPLGIRFADYASAFLSGGTVAASWDRGDWYRRGFELGSEFRGKGVDVMLGPVVGPLGRAPEGGRNWEGFSPDPVLSGIAVAETIRGIQDAGVIACTKHFILNEQEHFRQAGEAQGYKFNVSESSSSNVDDVTMHELYLWPFADAVRAGTGAIMCSYQQINNSYACQNSHALNYLLKQELGFQGFVVSDWSAQHSGVSSALAGLDMTMPGDTSFVTGLSYWGSNLTLAVINGTVPEWRIDDMVTRILAAWYYVGRDKNTVGLNFNSWTTSTYGLEHPTQFTGYGLVNQHVDVREQHGLSIRSYASRSTVLLKNANNALPLTGFERFTAVLGEDAADNPWGPNGCPDRGCDNGTLAMGWGSGTSNFPYLVSPLTAIQNKVVSVGGVIQSVTDNYALNQAQTIASQASVSLVFVNSDSGEGYISVDGNLGDRRNLTLWKDGEGLISAVASKCNNTIVIIHSVGPVLVDKFYDHENVTAILWAGLPGEQSGNAITDIIYGQVNPAAKLPFTIGASREDYGTGILYEPNNGNDAPQQGFTEGIFIDYRAFDKSDKKPIYEFGFGLSYTTFIYSNIQVTKYNVGPLVPTTGFTEPAPELGNHSADPKDYQFPQEFTRLPNYIYPYLSSTDPKSAYNNTDYGLPVGDWLLPNAQKGTQQAKVPAGGAPGGHPQLYDVMYTVTAEITNTGKRGGEEVVQLYISLGGPNDAKVVLRNFERLSIDVGQTTTFRADITRRDISNWDSAGQAWVIRDSDKTLYVGSSSRSLQLSARLPR